MLSLRFKYNSLGNSKKRIVSNVGWAITGKVVRVFTEILVGISVARYLGPTQYGLLNYVISYVAIFSIIASFGLDNIEIRELAKPYSEREKILGTAFRIRLLLSIATLVLIVATLFIFRADYATAILIVIYSISIILSSFNVIRNYFTSIVQNKYVVITEIVRSVIGALVKVALLLLHAQLIWFIVALLFDSCLIAGGYISSYRNKIDEIKNWYYDKQTAKTLIKESFPLLLSGAAVIIYQRIDQVMIKNMLNDASVGYFSVAGKFVELILFIPLVLSQTIAPLLVQVKERNIEEYNNKKQRFVDTVVWTSIILAILCSICSYWLVRYTFGKEYIAAVPVLQIMAFKAVGMALSNSSGQLIIIEGIQKWAVFRNLIGCVVCIVCNLLFIPKYGIIGSAWATIITVAFTGCIANIFIKPYHNILHIQLLALSRGWKATLSLRSLLK